MNTDDFVKLPADLAAEICKQFRSEGQLDTARLLDLAYLARHGISLDAKAAELARQDRSAGAVVAMAQSATRTVQGGISRFIGTWKACPHCQSRIKAAASVCRYCQRDVA